MDTPKKQTQRRGKKHGKKTKVNLGDATLEVGSMNSKNNISNFICIGMRILIDDDFKHSIRSIENNLRRYLYKLFKDKYPYIKTHTLIVDCPDSSFYKRQVGKNAYVSFEVTTYYGCEMNFKAVKNDLNDIGMVTYEEIKKAL